MTSIKSKTWICVAGFLHWKGKGYQWSPGIPQFCQASIQLVKENDQLPAALQYKDPTQKKNKHPYISLLDT